MGRKIDVRFLNTDIQKAIDDLGYDTHREFVASLFLTKHNVIVDDFSKLKYKYLPHGVIVTGEIGVSLQWK